MTPDSGEASGSRFFLDRKRGLGSWFEDYAWIKAKSMEVIQPALNVFQARVVDAIVWCLINEEPIRIIILKPRQKGSSTISVAALDWFAHVFGANGVIMGGQSDQADLLWEILKRYITHDKAPWDHSTDAGETRVKYGNGGYLKKETAGDKDAGKSGTWQFVLATEIAYWASEGVNNAEGVLASVMAAVPKQPLSCCILESTSNGPSGVFYDTWQHGVDLERLQDGEPRDGRYIKIFSPWFEHDDSRLDLDQDGVTHILRSMTPEERAILSRWNLTPGHIAWRRWAIREDCSWDEALFRMYFPATPEEAFSSSNPSLFNSAGLQVIARQTETIGCGMNGNLLNPDGDPWAKRFLFEPETDVRHASVTLWDRPVAGMRYVIGVDVMTGESEDSRARYRDHHAAVVLRTGYWDAARNRWFPPKVVARSIAYRPGGIGEPRVDCQWEIERLAEVVWALAQFFGGALIAPEVNQDRGLTVILKHHRARIYRQKKRDTDTSVAENDSTGKLGWRTKPGKSTTDNTKAHMYEQMRTAVVELAAGECGEDMHGRGIEIPCPHIYGEMLTFIQHKNGRIGHANGLHDDGIDALAIAFAVREGATPYVPDSLVRAVPADLRAHLGRSSMGRAES